MKKLRLIKPWRLHATRQKLTDTRLGGVQDVASAWIPCSGPVGTESLPSRYVISGLSGTADCNIHGITRTAAPAADAIFAATKQGIR